MHRETGGVQSTALNQSSNNGTSRRNVTLRPKKSIEWEIVRFHQQGLAPAFILTDDEQRTIFYQILSMIEHKYANPSRLLRMLALMAWPISNTNTSIISQLARGALIRLVYRVDLPDREQLN